MYSKKEVSDWATCYSAYCMSVRANQMLPMDFEDFFEKKEKTENLKYETSIDEVINFLNIICQNNGKRGFKAWGKKIRSLIRTKLKQGFEINDLYDVIDTKSSWINDKSMHKYFRPSTLFGSKFEDYLNETTEPIQDNKSENEYAEAIRRAAIDNY